MIRGKVLRIGYISKERVPDNQLPTMETVSANVDVQTVTDTTVKPLLEANLQSAEPNDIYESEVLSSI